MKLTSSSQNDQSISKNQSFHWQFLVLCKYLFLHCRTMSKDELVRLLTQLVDLLSSLEVPPEIIQIYEQAVQYRNKFEHFEGDRPTASFWVHFLVWSFVSLLSCPLAGTPFIGSLKWLHNNNNNNHNDFYSAVTWHNAKNWTAYSTLFWISCSEKQALLIWIKVFYCFT